MFVEEKTQGEPAKVLSPEANVLFKAADYLQRYGWCQGNLYADGAACAVGAIYQAGQGVDKTRAFGAFAKSVGGDERSGNGIAKWNDTPGRTRDEVISKLRAVALGL